jgi:acetoin utilization protein AcuB
MDDAIENFMTTSLHTISGQRTLAEAHALMREHKIRHLPVLDSGRLVGIVTERDLSMVETLDGVDPRVVKVADAMSEDVYAVERGTPLAEVAQRMAHDRFGSAVVMSRGKPVGIFTAVDALRALDFLLSSPSIRLALHEAMVPGGVAPAWS